MSATQWKTCPKCRYEYLATLVMCPTCHRPLVDPPSPQAAPVIPAVERVHELTEVPIGEVTAAQRNALDLVLRSENIVHQIVGNHVVVPADRSDVVRDAMSWIMEAEPLEPPDPLDSEASPTDDAGSGSPVATVAQRILGFMIDGLFTAPFTALAQRGLIGWPTAIAVIAGYHIVLVALFGRTIGKVVMRSRVVAAEDWSLPTWRASAIRWAIPSVTLLSYAFNTYGLLGLWSLGVYLPILRDPWGRGLHDQTAGTRVLDDRRR